MITLDTNVIVRLIVEDDEAQATIAIDTWRSALNGGGVFLPVVALVETVWVLRRAYGFDRETIVAAMERLLTIKGVSTEAEPVIRRALHRYHLGPADFADYVILGIASHSDALPVYSFDRKLAKAGEAELLAVE